MSVWAWSLSEAVERISRRDLTLKGISLSSQQLTDSGLAELADCLLAHPDVVATVFLIMNQLTDETGIKLARYLAASSTIKILNLSYNQLGSATYLAVAAALRVNTSLRRLNLSNNQAADRTRIEAAFVEALRLNTDRPDGSDWQLYSTLSEYRRLKKAANELGHPSLQLLTARLLTDDRPTGKLGY